MATIIATTWPDAATKAQFAAGRVQRVSWVDIYASDNITLLYPSVDFTEATVSIDGSRTERRNFEVTIVDKDRVIGYGPTKFWYDKVLKPYTGIVLANGDTWVMKMGEYLPDVITRSHFPEIMAVSCRDFTKKLINSKFEVTTTFVAGGPTTIGGVIRAIAINGGIASGAANFNFTDDFNIYLALDVTFERGTERMTAISELAASRGWEVFFDGQGRLNYHPIFRPQAGVSVAHVFSADAITSNLVDFALSTNDSFLRNKVIVYGESTENALVYAVASNTTASSPTRIAAIGERIEFFPSQFVATNADAQEIANAFLSVSALEQYDMTTNGIVIPWLGPGQNVEFDNPDAEVGDPINFYVSNVSIPLHLGSMSGNVKRVTTVG